MSIYVYLMESVRKGKTACKDESDEGRAMEGGRHRLGDLVFCRALKSLGSVAFIMASQPVTVRSWVGLVVARVMVGWQRRTCRIQLSLAEPCQWSEPQNNGLPGSFVL